MKFKYFLLLIIIIILVSCQSNNSSSSSDSTTDAISVVETKLLESEFGNPSNWKKFVTYDKKESISSPKMLSVSEDVSITYMANGLLSREFDFLMHTDTELVAVDQETGISIINFNNVDSPKGNVINYRGEVQSVYFYQDILYAWTKDQKLINVRTEEILVDSPSALLPTDELIVLDNGFYFNSHEGLWKISSDFSVEELLISHSSWDLFKDSTNQLWVGTNNGVYLGDGVTFSIVYSGYASKILEFSGQIYALVNTSFMPSFGETSDYDLYKWNGTTFVYHCEVGSLWGSTSQFIELFEWNSKLYAIKLDGGSTLEFDGTVFTAVTPIVAEIGRKSIIEINNILYSTGNINGIKIWDGAISKNITGFNTAEGMLSNKIQRIFTDSIGNIWLGPKTDGVSILDNSGAFINISFPDEIKIAGIFEYEGTVYINGANNLYTVTDFVPTLYTSFHSHGENVYFDQTNGKLWALPNGVLAMLDINTKEMWGMDDGYWTDTRDYAWNNLGYHFHDVIAIPNENAVFIAVEANIILKYNYGTNKFTEIAIPTAIKKFVNKNGILYGVSESGQLLIYDITWTIIESNLESVNITNLSIKDGLVFITSEDSKIEIFDLATHEKSIWTSQNIPIEGSINEMFIHSTIALSSSMTMNILDESTKEFSMVLATENGLVICSFNIE